MKTVLPYANPVRAGRHPMQSFVMGLCVVSGIPLLINGYPAAQSINHTLPPWLASVWGFTLVVGATFAIVGAFWRGDYGNGLTLERVGVALTGWAAIVYAGAIIAFAGIGGAVSALIVLGFGLAACKRARDIRRVLNRAVTLEAEGFDPSTEP